MDFDYGSDEDNEIQEFQTTREGIIFCIDASDRMLGGEDDAGMCYLQRCFKCARDRMLNNIMLSDKEFVGIALLGVQPTANAGAAAGTSTNTTSDVAILFDVSRPGADILKKLDQYIKSSVNNFVAKFRDDYSPVPCSLAEALWFCQSMLSMANTKFGPKELLLMTCDDQSDMDVASRRQACKRAEALMQVGVCLRLFYLGEQFNIEAFYKELLISAHPWSRGDFESEDEKFTAINIDKNPQAALTRSCYNRHLFRLDCTITKNIAMTVILYALFRKKLVYETKKIVKLDQRTNVQVRTNLARFDNETGDLVTLTQIYKGTKVSDRSAIFSHSEKNSMRSIYSPPGLVLLGFKPISEVNLEDFIKAGMFLQPDDAAREGSSSIFFALLQRCLDREVVPVCRLVLRAGTGARIVYLLPQRKGSEELGALGMPGFHIVVTPFAGECRSIDQAQRKCTPTEEQLTLMKAIIKKLRVNYEPSTFHNPSVTTHFAAIEALALEYENPAEVEDSVDPDVEGMDARIGLLAEQFLASVATSDYVESLEGSMDMEAGSQSSRVSRGSRSSSSSQGSSRGRARGGRGSRGPRGGRGRGRGASIDEDD